MAKQRIGKGLGELINSQKSARKRKDTLLTYSDAVRSAFADGIVTEDEKTVLENLAKSLGVKKKEMKVIIKDAREEFKEEIAKAKKPKKGKKPVMALPPSNEEEMELRTLRIEKEALEKEVDILHTDDRSLEKRVKELTDERDKLRKEKKALEMKVRALEERNRELEGEIRTEEVEEVETEEPEVVEGEEETEGPVEKTEEPVEVEEDGEEVVEEEPEEETEEVEEEPEEETEEVEEEPEEKETSPPAEPVQETAPEPAEAEGKEQIDALFDDIQKHDQTTTAAKGRALPEKGTGESHVGSLHDDGGESMQKHVLCPNCNADILVELIPGEPTVFTCSNCGQKSFTEPD